MDLLLYRMTCNMKIVSRLCIDPNYLEVAAVGDQRGWAVAPCRSHHGSPGEKIFAGLQLKPNRITSQKLPNGRAFHRMVHSCPTITAISKNPELICDSPTFNPHFPFV